MYPRTAVEILLRILGRDGAQKSAHTMLADALDPHRRIGRALDIYLDAIGVAAENVLGPESLDRLDTAAETLRPNLTDSPAYPVLRQHLATIALSGRDPIAALHAAASARELDTADDAAAVLDWRLDPSGTHSTGNGPLPWAFGIPRGLRAELDSTQLVARARIVADLAYQIRTDVQSWTPASAPHWARPLIGSDPHLISDLAVWRSSLHIDDRDLRPTGPPRYTVGEREHQDLLDARVTQALGDLHLPANKWAPLITRLEARVLTDPWWPTMADKIEVANRSGIDIETRLTHAAAARPLPDDMPAAALWSRLELEPSAADTTGTHHNLRPDWAPELHALFGDDIGDRVINDPAWPRLVAAIDRATGTDWTPRELLTTAHELILGAQPDSTTNLRPDQLASALAWRCDALLREPTHLEQPDIDTSMEFTMHPPDDRPDPPHAEASPHATAAQSAPWPPTRPPDNAPVNEPRLHTGVQMIAALFQSGDLRAARRAFVDLTDPLTDEESDIIERVATTLYRYAFPNALARLRWAADRFPQHRELIRAFTPDTDPHVYQVATDRSATTSGRVHRAEAAHDHPDRVDVTARRAPLSDAEVAAEHSRVAYLNNRSDVDDDPHHLPLPEGVPHHYYRGKVIEEPVTDEPIEPDYDRFAVRATRALPCVACGIDRAVIDTTPRLPRRSDDGLCSECRDNDEPAIPDHHAAEHIRARCDHIAATQPPASVRAMLRRDWRAARTLSERLAISAWIDTHPQDTTPHSQATAPDDPPLQNPLIVLTDEQLQQQIDDIHLRIELVDNEAILYGPAPDPRGSDADYDDEVRRHHAAQQAIRNARSAEQKLSDAVQAVQATATELDTARSDLEATPAYRRGTRREVQARIDALLTEQKNRTDTRESARTTAHKAQRDAALYAGTADGWDRLLATPDPEHTYQRPVQQDAAADVDTRARIADFRQQIDELRTEQQRRGMLNDVQLAAELQLRHQSILDGDSSLELIEDPIAWEPDIDLGL